ncbi:hypothetical protein RAB80_000149 [Fusarium oxysporum f. sp. vasinfectum]|nr:hypothetical protein RAB80_000149 [Fusarium oxysporum f. sp. vasinfectum]KAK2938566.1 hypothetical protein FoTM2_001784 [Fusarium oxysporum f. sp. vasinfectum]
MAELNIQKNRIDETEVDFQNNTVDSSKLKGGYSTWQLIPGGPAVKVGDTSKEITGQFTTLNCANQQGEVDPYKPDKPFTFEAGEELALTGPDDSNTVTFSGESSGKSEWKLSKDK